MSAPTLIVSTCGTSILRNVAKDLGNNHLDTINATANLKEGELERNQKTLIDRIAQLAQDKLSDATPAQLRPLSAELNGLIAFYDGKLRTPHPSNIHIFLHSDTYQGALAASLVEQTAKNHGLSTQLQLVQDLNAADLEQFRMAMGNLVEFSANTVRGYRQRGYHVVFNLVGGFKCFQAFMQTLGMLHADETIYIFEHSDHLLRIPRLPLEMDHNAKALIRQNLLIFRTLQFSDLPAHQCTSIPETLLNRIADRCNLSPWGTILWQEVRNEAYRQRLLDPPIKRIRYAQSFNRDLGKHRPGPELLEALNTRIDDLARFLHTGQNPNRLDLKPLKGDPKPPATREFDVTHHGAAYRAFGHYEGQVFVLDHFGKHL